MRSRAYSRIRVCSQVISTTLILLNASGIMYFLSKQIICTVEGTLEVKPFLSFQDTSQYICAINILFGLLANCSITSGIKLYMKAFSKLAYIQVGCSLASVIYFYGFYKPALFKSVAISMSKSSQYIGVPNSLGLPPIENGCHLPFQEEIEFVAGVFCILQAVTIVFNYLLIKIFQFAISVKLEVADQRHPQILEATHIGLSSGALQERQVVALKSVAG